MVRDELVDVAGLFCAHQGDHPNRTPVKHGVVDEIGNFVDDGLGLRLVDVLLPISALHEHVHQRWVKPLIRLGHTQGPDVAFIELPVGELDDGGH